MSEERTPYVAKNPPRSERPDLYECEACNAKAGSPWLCERCIQARAVAGSDWVGRWGPKPPSLIPTPSDTGAAVLRKVGLLMEHFNVRVTELKRTRAATSSPFICSMLDSMAELLTEIYTHHNAHGWESLPARIEEMEHDQEYATDPAVRDMLGILIDELESLCVDDEA